MAPSLVSIEDEFLNKFNPHHDERGRFTSKDTSITTVQPADRVVKVIGRLRSLIGNKKIAEHTQGQIKQQPDLDLVILRGELFPTKGRQMIKGIKSMCHYNVSKLFLAGKIDGVVTGLALQDYGDGKVDWIDHTWGVKDGKVVETTTHFTKYFGAKLTDEESKSFSSKQISEFDRNWKQVANAGVSYKEWVRSLERGS